MERMGDLIEAHGWDVERGYGFTLADISQKLAQGQKVIVGLDAREIWEPENVWKNNLQDLAHLAGIPGQGANHAVEVIGIDDSDPQNPVVILNDSGTPYGRGERVPAAEFEDAWADSGHFMVYTIGQRVQPDYHGTPYQTAVYQPSPRGYSNSDGTYCWTGDNTDRDPQTGAIVRRF